jgi:glucan phosphoethanolaminetransferase (alkaline phosphatase superfamily)
LLAVTAAARVVADLCIWLIPSAVFLRLYVGEYSLPATSIVPHARVVLTLWLALAAIRILAGIVLGWRIALWVSAFALAIGVTALLSYYSLVIMGLKGWGGVITWDLVRTYALQFPAFADALGLSLLPVAGALALTCAVVFTVALLYLRRFDWVPLLQQKITRGVMALVCGASFAIVGIEMYTFTAAPWTQEREPLSLSLHSSEASSALQSHKIDRVQAERLDRLEDLARASYVSPATAERRNVVLIVVDALRPDHLGLLGYPRDTTPHLDAIARKSVHTAALTLHASCAESMCGLASLSSSKYVHQISYRPITLTEVLKRNGYRVHLVLGGDHTHFYGLREMYGKVDTYFDGSMATEYYFNDDRLVLNKVASLPHWDGVPAMFQFHLMSAHMLGKRLDEYKVFAPAASYSITSKNEDRQGRPTATAVNYYDNGVRQTDAMIAQLLDELASKGYLSNAVVAITADHGELLGEHGLYAHARSAYEEVLRVPLIFLSFGYRPEKPINEQVIGSQVDVAPTILAEVGISKPATWVGVPLQDSYNTEITYFQEGNYAGLYDHRVAGKLWKYYIDMGTGTESAIDVTLNPTERDDAINLVPSTLKREWRSLVLPTARGGLLH